MCMSLARDNETTTEDVVLTEKTFGSDVGGLKGMTTRSKSSPTQSQEIEIPREWLSLCEETETSLDGLHANGQSFVTCISHQTHHRIAIPTNSTGKVMLMKELDDIFQVYHKCGF